VLAVVAVALMATVTLAVAAVAVATQKDGLLILALCQVV
jgi:hypothetical protein